MTTGYFKICITAFNRWNVTIVMKINVDAQNLFDYLPYEQPLRHGEDRLFECYHGDDVGAIFS